MTSRRTRSMLLVLAAGVGLVVMMAAGALPRAGGAVTNPVNVRVLGQDSWLADSRVGLRVIVTDHQTGKPLPALLRVSVTPAQGQPVLLYSGRTGREGSADVQFATGRLAPGDYQLAVQASTPAGLDRVERPVRVRRQTRIMLTTDKPLYQPGQTIHIRALALGLPSLKPAAGRPLTLEVEDARGNKVFKRKVECSRFGVGSADFVLAQELNMGRFVVRALTEDGREERSVTVERYVLPKFKVTLTTDRKYYRPGERITGRVQAGYFFGKPVDRAEVQITAQVLEGTWRTVAELKGTTDATGGYRYELELPSYLVGQPSEGGKAVVKLIAQVTDRAKHEQQVSQSVPVTKGSLVVRLIPAGGRLQAGLAGDVYVITSTPDGQAAPARVTLSIVKVGRRGEIPPVEQGEVVRHQVRTDELGLARVRLQAPRDCTAVAVRVQATSRDGSFDESLPVACAAYGQEDQPVALLVEQPLAKVGEEVTITALTTGKSGAIFLDLVKDRQTVLTRTLEVKDGRAQTTLTAGPELVGMVTVNAYRVSPSENITRDSRLLWVEAADSLKIQAQPSKQSYRPGEEASVAFRVTDRQDHPVLAALGIAVVDEAVFALSEMQPGLEQLYFRLEQELMSPRYEVHGFGLPSLLQEQPQPKVGEQERRQLAAGALFALAPQASPFTLSASSFQDRLERLRKQALERLEADRKRIERALAQYYARHRTYLEGDRLGELVQEGLLPAGALKDFFGTPYRADAYGVQAVLISAGPDRKFDTPDDLRSPQAMVMERMLAMDAVGGVRMQQKAAGLPALAPSAPAPPGQPQQPEVRVREFFPETMFWEPALITDEQGRATLRLPMADSITTWRLTALGSSLAGKLGSLDIGLRCFQDFFVDLDLPVALTQGDQVELPVAIYNYLPQAQTVTLTLERGDWFELDGDPVRQVRMAKDGVSVIYYKLTAKAIGMHKLTVTAKGTALSDAIRREIEVLPDGKETRQVHNGRLDAGKTIETKVELPAQGIDGAGTIFVKLYPGTFSQVVEGLDKMLRMPGGCFEQTSSMTYPNVLVLDYLRQTKQANPELAMKAAQYINVGYQRLVSFEVPGGGFSWFGDAPAHQVLTAYGLLEFHDMSKVHEVDPAVISRTQQWLAGRQQDDGTWQRDQGGIAEGIINRQTDTLRVTGYIAWALAETGYQGPQVRKALDWLRAHFADAKDPYALAVILNAFTAAGDRGADASRVADLLAAQAVVEGDVAYWKGGDPTFTGAGGKSADLETTALAAYALLGSRQHGGLTNKALLYLTQQKDSYGTWSTTQATVWAFKALLRAMSSASEDTEATVTILVNGRQAGEFTITPEDADVMRQLDLAQYVREGGNDITLRAKGRGSVLYQVVSRYYLPWELVRPGPQDLLSIQVSYDRTTLAKDDLLSCRVEVKNLTNREAKMVIVDLGLPPGFDLVPEGLDQAVKARLITKYTPAARQVIVYTEGIPARGTLTLNYQLRARYPLRARTTPSKAYPYYNPEQEALAGPTLLTVQ